MENNKQLPIKYAMYIRKSSESEDRQALSPESQIKENTKRVSEQGLIITEVFQESKSAKKPGREEFGRMMKKIENNEIQGIVCWSLDRLARNPIDGGRIMWAMQNGLLKHINTASSNHYQGDNVLVMQVNFGMANQFIIDLSKNTKRGLRAKAEQGFPPGVSKIGFLNDYNYRKGEKKVIVDEERLPIVKQMFDTFLTGNYSVRKIHKIAKDQLGLTTYERRKLGGKPMSLSNIHNVLTDPAYAGFFYYGGAKYKMHESLPRIITEEDHYRILKMVSSRKQGRERPKRHVNVFAYKERIKCGTCGCFVTAEIKDQLICQCKHKFSYFEKNKCPKCKIKITKIEEPKYLRYVYYHCTKKKQDIQCKERSVTDKEIDNQLRAFYQENLCISPALAKWCLERIEEIEKDTEKDTKHSKNSIENQVDMKEKQLDQLIDMRTRDLITDTVFLEKKGALEEEIKGLKENPHLKIKDPTNGKLRAINAISIIEEMDSILEKGSYFEKKELLSIFGSNLTLIDKKVNVSNDKIVSIFINGLKEAKTKNPQFEPENIQDTSSRNEVFADVCPTMLGR